MEKQRKGQGYEEAGKKNFSPLAPGRDAEKRDAAENCEGQGASLVSGLLSFSPVVWEWPLELPP